MGVNRKVFSSGLKLFDLLLMVVAFVVSTLPLFHRVGRFSLAEFFEMRVKLGNLILFLSFLLVWHILFSVFGLYGSKRMSKRWEEVRDIAGATTLGTIVIAAAALICPAAWPEHAQSISDRHEFPRHDLGPAHSGQAGTWLPHPWVCR